MIEPGDVAGLDPRRWYGYAVSGDWQPECICADCWKRNQAYGMGLTAWVCWVHGIVFPDDDGNPKPDEYREQLRARQKQARIARVMGTQGRLFD